MLYSRPVPLSSGKLKIPSSDSVSYSVHSAEHVHFATACLVLMNKETGGKDDLVPAHLSYSYRFGAEHLRDVPKEDHDQDLLRHQLKDFLHVHLVRWLDVMS
jgi:hypothetical protein